MPSTSRSWPAESVMANRQVIVPSLAMAALLILTFTPVATDGNWAAGAGLYALFWLAGRPAASAARTRIELAKTHRIHFRIERGIMRIKAPNILFNTI